MRKQDLRLPAANCNDVSFSVSACSFCSFYSIWTCITTHYTTTSRPLLCSAVGWLRGLLANNASFYERTKNLQDVPDTVYLAWTPGNDCWGADNSYIGQGGLDLAWSGFFGGSHRIRMCPHDRLYEAPKDEPVIVAWPRDWKKCVYHDRLWQVHLELSQTVFFSFL